MSKKEPFFEAFSTRFESVSPTIKKIDEIIEECNCEMSVSSCYHLAKELKQLVKSLSDEALIQDQLLDHYDFHWCDDLGDHMQFLTNVFWEGE